MPTTPDFSPRSPRPGAGLLLRGVRRVAAWARLPSQRGAALTELAVASPMLIVLVVGVADLGRSFYYREAVTNATRQAVRVAVQSSQEATGDYYCTNTSGTVTVNLPDATTSDKVATIANTAAIETSSDGAASGAVLANSANPTRITVTWHCANGLAITNLTATSMDPTNAGSDAIKVQIDYSFQIITPFVGRFTGGQTVHVRSTVIGRAEYP